MRTAPASETTRKLGTANREERRQETNYAPSEPIQNAQQVLGVRVGGD